jgi:hypothetical protein
MENFGISLLSSLIVTVLWTLILYWLRPKLTIDDLTIDNNHLKVKVSNVRNCSDAINVNVEICVEEDNDYTYHLEIDKSDFLIIPRNDNRVFQAIDLIDTTKKEYWDGKNFDTFIEEKIKNSSNTVRVRAYATHSFSGFGRAFEQKFQYNAGKFDKVK